MNGKLRMPEWTGRPVVMNIKAGDSIAYCMCGLSKNGPVCDGTHKDTSIKPQVEKYDADARISSCGCKRSKAVPMCDGTHKEPE